MAEMARRNFSLEMAAAGDGKLETVFGGYYDTTGIRYHDTLNDRLLPLRLPILQPTVKKCPGGTH